MIHQFASLMDFFFNNYRGKNVFHFELLMLWFIAQLTDTFMHRLKLIFGDNNF